MRITKVKVDNEMVLMKRNREQGYLSHSMSDFKVEEHIQNLLNRKYESFVASMVNKTLARLYFDQTTKPQEKKNRKCNQKVLENLLTYILTAEPDKLKSLEKVLNETGKFKYLKDIKSEDFHAIYLNRRFSSEYKEFSGKNLGTLLVEALRKSTLIEIVKHLEPYCHWVHDYIENKCRHLSRSIINNRLPCGTISGNSPRKKVLHDWGNEMINTGTINIEHLSQAFNLPSLIASCHKVLQKEQENMITLAKKQQADSAQQQPHSLVNLAKETFDIRVRLKEALQAHQQKIFSEKQQSSETEEAAIARKNIHRNNLPLAQYNLEVTKYFHHYFPVKKTKRSGFDLDYFQYYLQEKTVKQTVENQINNAVFQNLLQQGKYSLYEINEDNAHSQKLQQIKVQEAFTLQFLNACGFAANNLRNCVDPDQTKDIAGIKDLTESLNKITDQTSFEQAYTRLSQFFFVQYLDQNQNTMITDHSEIKKFLSDQENFNDICLAIRGSIAGIRNKLAHFKKNTHQSLFALDRYLIEPPIKTKQDKTNQYQNNHFIKQRIEKELGLIKQFFAEKLKSTGIFDYYPFNHIQKCFTQFSLTTKPLAFVPGFKRIFRWGHIYQADDLSGLELSLYFLPEQVTIDRQMIINPAHQAQYNALMLVYEQQFIHQFLNYNNESKASFALAVQRVLDANKKRAESGKNKEQYAFHEIIPYELNDSPIDYLKSIQSQLIIEEQKKRDEGTLTEDDTGHFQQFLWQVFIKGFNDFIQDHKIYNFIHHPSIQHAEQLAHQAKADQQNKLMKEFIRNESFQVAHNLTTLNNEIIAFWLFCKMLDNRHLNELSNQISKWQQAFEKDFTTAISHESKVLQEVIALCLLTADIIPSSWALLYQDKTSALESLAPYIYNSRILDQQQNIYVQEDRSPIVFRQVELAKKYAVQGLLSCLMNQNPDQFKVSKNNLDEWKKISKDNHLDNPAKLSLTRQKLHQAWAQAKFKNDVKEKVDPKSKKIIKPKITGWINSPCEFDALQLNGAYYARLCTQLEHYNWLKNKISLVHVGQLHHLVIDLLGRLVGYINLWERDWQFMISAIFPDKNYEANNIDIKKDDPNDVALIYRLFLDAKNTKYGKKAEILSDKTGNWKDKRNFIAHFNYLTRFNLSGLNIGIINNDHLEHLYTSSLLDLFMHVRNLVSYDRKLKNAVIQSLVTILERHGMDITLAICHQQNRLIINHLKPKKITHLGKAKVDKKLIQTDQVHEDYVAMVRALLELKV